MEQGGETPGVVVKVSASDGVRVRGGVNVLTTGGKFRGVNVSLAPGSPAWASGVGVNEDGDIYIDALPGLMLIVR